MGKKQPFGTFRKTTFGFVGGGGGHGRLGTNASLNLTPMIDMMTILLVFLIKSYSVEPAFLTPTQGIDLSITTSEVSAPDKAVLIIGRDGLVIEGKLIVKFKDGAIDPASVKNGEMPELKTALDALAAKTKFIAEKNSSVQFTGTLILQADKEVAFDALKPVLRTAGVAGFHDIKFAGLVEN